ncbi:MAG TPA: hypothetical protein VFL47_15840, partial [Flavisolibacter sp.]|nr:hypothetical protein [Flavisolibacter sp.]
MKTIILTTLLLASMAYQKCGKPATETIPSCVKARIEEIKKQPKWNPPAQVEEYRYNGKRV